MADYDPPQVLIIVRGGVVTEVLSTASLEVLILDHDEHPDEETETILSRLAGEFEPQALTDATL
jgi:hypothetical protein